MIWGHHNYLEWGYLSLFEWLPLEDAPWVDHCPCSSVSRAWVQIQTRMIRSSQAWGKILLAAMTLPKFSWVLMFNRCLCLDSLSIKKKNMLCALRP